MRNKKISKSPVNILVVRRSYDYFKLDGFYSWQWQPLMGCWIKVKP